MEEDTWYSVLQGKQKSEVNCHLFKFAKGIIMDKKLPFCVYSKTHQTIFKGHPV